MNTKHHNKMEVGLHSPASKRLGSPLLSDTQIFHLLQALSAGQGNFTEAEGNHVIAEAEKAFAAHAFYQLAIDGLFTLKIRAADLEIQAVAVHLNEVGSDTEGGA